MALSTALSHIHCEIFFLYSAAEHVQVPAWSQARSHGLNPTAPGAFMSHCPRVHHSLDLYFGQGSHPLPFRTLSWMYRHLPHLLSRHAEPLLMDSQRGDFLVTGPQKLIFHLRQCFAGTNNCRKKALKCDTENTVKKPKACTVPP